MPKIQYKEINFRGKSLELINLVNQVINEYKNQGYELTLRQTYYQLVARGYIPNNERSYKNIGNLINDGTAFRDDEIYQAVCDLEKRGKEELKMIERNYDRAVAFLESEV